MSSKETRNTVRTTVSTMLRILAGCLASMLFSAGTAMAVPVQAHYVDDAHCDSQAEQFPSHELGDAVSSFPLDERIQVLVAPGPVVCVADDGLANDFLVEITNLGSVAYVNLFLVADTGSSVGNFDGWIEDLLGPPGAFEQAFKIDGTVTLGVNNNLISEDMGINEIFEPGETWQFLITNLITPASSPPAPIFGSAGAFAATSTSGLSNVSIVATPVPEPTASLLITLGVAALCRRRSNPGMSAKSDSAGKQLAG